MTEAAFPGPGAQDDGLVFAPLHGRGPQLAARPALPGVDLAGWFLCHPDRLRQLLEVHGAIVFRDFAVSDRTSFARVARAVCPLAPYGFRSTRRSSAGDNVFTASNVAAAAAIPMHCENAYQREWPLRLMFYCEEPAPQGGATPLADMRAVTRAIPARIRDAFRSRGVAYVRNLGSRIDLGWQEVFQCQGPEEAEQACRRLGLDFQWRSGGVLRIRHVAQGLAVHPRTGDEIWFNQAHAFHPSLLDEKSRRGLAGMFREEDLPRNAFYGDGGPIAPEDLAAVAQALSARAVSFPWRRHDVLVLENMLTAHGREPYLPPRSVLAAMGELHRPKSEDERDAPART